MAEKPVKKVAIQIRRERTTATRIVVMTGFKLRIDKATGLLDVSLETAGGQKGERILLDPNILLSNLGSFKKYSAGLTIEQNDAAQKEEINVSDYCHFANIIHFSNMGMQSETVFGIFSCHDWVEASRAEGKQEIKSFDCVAAFSPSEIQKKFLMEMIVLLGQMTK